MTENSESTNAAKLIKDQLVHLNERDTKSTIELLLQHLIDLALQARGIDRPIETTQQSLALVAPMEALDLQDETIYDTKIVIRRRFSHLINLEQVEQALILRCRKVDEKPEVYFNAYREARTVINICLSGGGAIDTNGIITTIPQLTPDVLEKEFKGRRIRDLLNFGWLRLEQQLVENFNRTLGNGGLPLDKNYVIVGPGYINQLVMCFEESKKNPALLYFIVTDNSVTPITRTKGIPHDFLNHVIKRVYIKHGLAVDNDVIAPGSLLTCILYEIGTINYNLHREKVVTFLLQEYGGEEA